MSKIKSFEEFCPNYKSKAHPVGTCRGAWAFQQDIINSMKDASNCKHADLVNYNDVGQVNDWCNLNLCMCKDAVEKVSECTDWELKIVTTTNKGKKK